MNSQVRVRFAPSPTGDLHIGSFRTALFNYLFAKHNKGIFLVRIEDTDAKRSDKKYIQVIHDVLNWAQLKPDEPVIMQSDRILEHKKIVQNLMVQSKAYYCYCTAEEVQSRYQKNNATTDTYIKYDGLCRNKKIQNNDNKVERNSPVIRFALPKEKSTVSFVDAIRGKVTVSLDQLDDFIIARSDGSPTYNFVVVVDDIEQEITNIIRGDDHLANTPKQILLYEALNVVPPEFAHIPLILGPQGNKISKRDAAVSVVDYQKAGYLPDAFSNYMARLGWSHGDQEIFTQSELVQHFTLNNVGKKGSLFDQVKLDWLNGVYIREKASDSLLSYTKQYLPDLFEKIDLLDRKKVIALLDLYKKRCNTLVSLCESVIQALSEPLQYNKSDLELWITPESIYSMQEFLKIVAALDSFELSLVQEVTKKWCKENNIGLKNIAQPLRIALIGRAQSPAIFEIVSILGKKEVESRVQILLQKVIKV